MKKIFISLIAIVLTFTFIFINLGIYKRFLTDKQLYFISEILYIKKTSSNISNLKKDFKVNVLQKILANAITIENNITFDKLNIKSTINTEPSILESYFDTIFSYNNEHRFTAKFIKNKKVISFGIPEASNTFYRADFSNIPAIFKRYNITDNRLPKTIYDISDLYKYLDDEGSNFSMLDDIKYIKSILETIPDENIIYERTSKTDKYTIAFSKKLVNNLYNKSKHRFQSLNINFDKLIGKLVDGEKSIIMTVEFDSKNKMTSRVLTFFTNNGNYQLTLKFDNNNPNQSCLVFISSPLFSLEIESTFNLKNSTSSYTYKANLNPIKQSFTGNININYKKLSSNHYKYFALCTFNGKPATIDFDINFSPENTNKQYIITDKNVKVFNIGKASLKEFYYESFNIVKILRWVKQKNPDILRTFGISESG